MEKEKVEEVTNDERLTNAERNLKEVVDDYEVSLVESKATMKEVDATLEKVAKDQEKIAQDIARREREVFDKEKAFMLKESGLEAFADIINVGDSEQLADVVVKLTAIVNEIKVGAGYIPKENIKESDYDIYAQKKDTKGMIGSKLANLFKSQ